MASQQWMVAQDSFNAELKSGASLTVTKGAHFLSGHEVVAKDEGRGVLFKPADEPEPESPAPPGKSQPAKAEAKAEPVKAAGKAS